MIEKLEEFQNGFIPDPVLIDKLREIIEAVNGIDILLASKNDAHADVVNSLESPDSSRGERTSTGMDPHVMTDECNMWCPGPHIKETPAGKSNNELVQDLIARLDRRIEKLESPDSSEEESDAGDIPTGGVGDSVDSGVRVSVVSADEREAVDALPEPRGLYGGGSGLIERIEEGDPTPGMPETYRKDGGKRDGDWDHQPPADEVDEAITTLHDDATIPEAIRNINAVKVIRSEIARLREQRSDMVKTMDESAECLTVVNKRFHHVETLLLEEQNETAVLKAENERLQTERDNLWIESGDYQAKCIGLEIEVARLREVK